MSNTNSETILKLSSEVIELRKKVKTLEKELSQLKPAAKSYNQIKAAGALTTLSSFGLSKSYLPEEAELKKILKRESIFGFTGEPKELYVRYGYFVRKWVIGSMGVPRSEIYLTVKGITWLTAQLVKRGYVFPNDQ